MHTNQTKIAVSKLAFFDSGQGGLTIWNHITQQFPGLQTIYLGDNARYPFGTKSAATVRRYTTEAILALTEMGADAIVVACGTASSVAVPGLTTLFNLPIMGVVEGMSHQTVACLKRLRQTLGTVAVLGTPYTVKSQRFVQATKTHPDLLELFRSTQMKIDFWSQACPLFVPLVEEGFQAGSIVESSIHHYLQDIPLDTRVVLLGCTHFPRLIQPIRLYLEQRLNRPVRVYKPVTPASEPGASATGEDFDSGAVYLIDPALAVEEHLRARFTFRKKQTTETAGISGQSSTDSLRSPENSLHDSSLVSEIFCTDDPEGFERTARIFCTQNLPKVQKKVISL